jgi:hypothetical protein
MVESLLFLNQNCLIEKVSTIMTYAVKKIITRKKVNSGAQTVTVDREPPPLPCLPAVMPAVQTTAVCIFFFYFFFF